MKRFISITLVVLFLIGSTGCRMSEGVNVVDTTEEATQRSESPAEGSVPGSGQTETANDSAQTGTASNSAQTGTASDSAQTGTASDSAQTGTASNSAQANQTSDKNPLSAGEENSAKSESHSNEDKMHSDGSSTPLTQTEKAQNASPSAPLPEPADDDLVRVLDYIPQIRQELAYATLDNFSGQRIYDFTDAYLRYGTVKKLAQVCDELAEEGLGLKIWDGFRPMSAQELLWEICPDETYVSNPETGNCSHCRGSAVDVTLVDLQTGEELPVPTGFDHFSDYADRDYSDVSPEAAENATLLEETMEKYGFKPYSAEWWHFTDTDEYPIDKYFDPALPVLWEANCERHIGMLQSTASSKVLKRIPAGGTFKLLGWSGKYARVTYGNTTGYVMSSYIMPEDDDYFEDCLETVDATNVYSYGHMLKDIEELQSAYPDIVTTESIGSSELGKDIPVIRIGEEDAKYHVLLQGAIHGREHLTAWLLMAMTDYWLGHDILSYGDICYHIIPMSNPDGVAVSQTETLSESQLKIYRSDVQLGNTNDRRSTYAGLWKANALGLDINRDFPAGWDAIIKDRTAPSSQNYQGKEPFATAEGRALRDYTLQYDFDTTISYHATGSLIYYEFGEKQPVNDLSKSLGRAVKEISGYDLVGSDPTSGSGYKDWAMEYLDIPSLTIEIGCQLAPLAEREIYSVFARNFRVLPAIARWLQK